MEAKSRRKSLFRKTKAWIARHPAGWTAIVAFFTSVTFLIGPFLQERTTTLLEGTVTSDLLQISVCTPLRSAVLVITSSSGNADKVHSANQMPFLQHAIVVVHNNSKSAISESRVLILPINSDANKLMSASMYTDNTIEGPNYRTTKRRDGAFEVNLSEFMPNQTLVFDSLSFYPTAFLVEFLGKDRSVRHFTQAGECENILAPTEVTYPSDFYSESFGDAQPSGNNFKIDDIVNPIGPISFKIVYEYDCGAGVEQKVTDLRGEVDFCGIRLNGGSHRAP